MRFLLILSVLLISGCATNHRHSLYFPEMPSELLFSCPDLHHLKPGAKLSDVSHVINANYALYHECAARHAATIKWFQSTRNLFEENKLNGN